MGSFLPGFFMKIRPDLNLSHRPEPRAGSHHDIAARLKSLGPAEARSSSPSTLMNLILDQIAPTVGLRNPGKRLRA